LKFQRVNQSLEINNHEKNPFFDTVREGSDLKTFQTLYGNDRAGLTANLTRNRNAIPNQTISVGTAQNFYMTSFQEKKPAKSFTPRNEVSFEGETEYRKTFQKPGYNQKVFQTV